MINKKSLLQFPIVILLVSLIVIFQNQALSQNVADDADLYLNRLVPFGFSGSVLISVDEKVVLNKGYGLQDPSTSKLNSAETIYSLGSIVKPFTATLIMKLVQDGKLSVDDTLPMLFNDVPADKEGIQIHHLLSHSSGLSGAIGMDTEYISKEDYLKKAMNSDLKFDPGTRYAYSNVGFTLLAMIIEKVSGKSYEQYLKTIILDPARMVNTGYSLPDWDKTKMAHNINQGVDNGTFLDREHFPTWHLIGNGGMLSTTTDMFRFYQFMKSDRLLDEKSKKLMWTPVFMEDAYGWVNVEDGEILQHNGGGMDGNGAVMKWYANEDIFMMIFTNKTVDGQAGFMLVEQPIEAMIFGDKVSVPPEINKYAGAAFNDISGQYESNGKHAVDVIIKGDEISFQPQNQASINFFFNRGVQSEYLSDEWNEKVNSILKKAVELKEYGELNMIAKNPERLKKSIINEIEMEGYQNPKVKVLYSSIVKKGITKTLVAISDRQFVGESLLFHLMFQDGDFAGLGVDFGNAEYPEIKVIPVSDHGLVGYDFASGKTMNLEVTLNEDKKLSEIESEGNSLKVKWLRN